ncbi:Ribonucleotide-diphosphate reductase (RNR), small subunit [Phlyctochytrium planicorne]|nr:Ribonucleotide-diphosphate reductase (RNR), small subunit [Phlyctochytrium planicorne]
MCYKHAESKFWSAEELEFSEDVEGWTHVPSPDQSTIAHLLAYLASGQFCERNQLLQLFNHEIQVPEARCFFGFQIMQANIHIEVYQFLLDTLVKEPAFVNSIAQRSEQSPMIQSRDQWIQAHVTASHRSFTERLFSLSIALSIFNSGALHLLHRLSALPIPGHAHALPGLKAGVERIKEDYGSYLHFYECLMGYVRGRVSVSDAREWIGSAVEVEVGIVDELGREMGGSAPGMVGEVREVLVAAGERLLGSVVVACDDGQSGAMGGKQQQQQQQQQQHQQIQQQMQQQAGAMQASMGSRDQLFSLDEDF